MQVVVGTQQISIGVLGAQTAWTDTLDRDLLLSQSRANEVHSSGPESLSGTGKYVDKGITPCFTQSNLKWILSVSVFPHLEGQKSPLPTPPVFSPNHMNTEQKGSISKVIIFIRLKKPGRTVLLSFNHLVFNSQSNQNHFYILLFSLYYQLCAANVVGLF